MMKRWLVPVIGLGLLVVGVAAYLAVVEFPNPLRKSNEDVRALLLEQTPLGMTRADVEFLLKAKGWQHSFTVDERGFNTARAIIGEYQGFPWWVFVEGVWVFDGEGKLIEVKVDKIYDSP